MITRAFFKFWIFAYYILNYKNIKLCINNFNNSVILVILILKYILIAVDVFQVEDKEKESIQTINAQPINQITNSSIDTNTPNKNNSVRLKHPLLKQASLNNPRTYSTNTSQPYGQTSENTSYHPNKNLSKLYTSNQDFGKVSSNLQNEQSSSPNSSNYQFNSPSRNRERIRSNTAI